VLGPGAARGLLREQGDGRGLPERRSKGNRGKKGANGQDFLHGVFRLRSQFFGSGSLFTAH
jgi:hypothetical protein